MKAQSDTKPEKFVKSRGKTQVNFNIQQVEITDDQCTRQIWEFDYVEIESKVTKAKVTEALNRAQLEEDPVSWTPDEVVSQFNDSKNVIDLSDITGITYSQLDTYIDNNVTDLASTKTYLKKLSKVVLAILKRQDLN